MKYQNKDWLYNEYITNNRLLKDMALECNVVTSVIWYHLDKHKIKKEKKNRYNCDGKKICRKCPLDAIQNILKGNK